MRLFVPSLESWLCYAIFIHDCKLFEGQLLKYDLENKNEINCFQESFFIFVIHLILSAITLRIYIEVK